MAAKSGVAGGSVPLGGSGKTLDPRKKTAPPAKGKEPEMKGGFKGKK